MESTFTERVDLFQRDKGWYYVSVPPELSKPLEYLADHGPGRNLKLADVHAAHGRRDTLHSIAGQSAPKGKAVAWRDG